MSRLTKLSVAALATALAVPGIVAADGDTTGTATFESLTVTAGAGTIEVVGSASFGGEELVISSDASGDGLAPGAGTDITGVRVFQDPATGVLEIAMDTDLAAGATAPGLAWTFGIGGSSLASPQLVAFSTDEQGVPGSFQFGLATGGGINEDFGIQTVTGRVDGSSLVWVVDPVQLGIEVGGTLKIAEGATSTYGSRNAGFSLLAAAAFDSAAQTEKFGIGGGANVEVLDAAGENVDQMIARVRKGEFSASFDDLAPGAYTVVVKSGYADGEAVETFAVTVS